MEPIIWNDIISANSQITVNKEYIENIHVNDTYDVIITLRGFKSREENYRYVKKMILKGEKIDYDSYLYDLHLSNVQPYKIYLLKKITIGLTENDYFLRYKKFETIFSQEIKINNFTFE